MQDHRSVALEHACMWAAYAQENGTAITDDQILAAAQKFAAFLSQPTDVRIVIDQATPTSVPTMKPARKQA